MKQQKNAQKKRFVKEEDIALTFFSFSPACCPALYASIHVLVSTSLFDNLNKMAAGSGSRGMVRKDLPAGALAHQRAG